jgi:hypothetical protein
MPRKRPSQRKHLKPKAVLRLPDLDQAKSAVLNSLSSADAQRGYRHAIDEFVQWYCSEPRLSFSRCRSTKLCAALKSTGCKISSAPVSAMNS